MIALRWTALLLTAAFLGVFLILPLLTAVVAGLQWQFLIEALSNPVYQRGFLNAAGIAVIVTALSLVMALPLAIVTSLCRFRGQKLAASAILAPLILPPFVGAIGVAHIFGQFGMLNTALIELGAIAPAQAVDWLGRYRFAAVCLLEALHLFPILYLLLCASLARLDSGLLEAAQVLGAGRWLRIRRVVLPLAMPALIGGGLIVFVWSFTELGTPLMLGYDRVTPVQIFNGLSDANANPTPFSLVVIVLIVSAVLSWLAHRFTTGYRAGSGKDGGRVQIALSGANTALVWLLFAGIAFVAVLPHLVVVVVSVTKAWYGTVTPSAYTGQHYREALGHALVVPGIRNSLAYAGGATVLAVVIGTWIAWMSSRWRPVGWKALDTVAMMPLAIPGIILAFGYLGMATRFGWLRTWLDPLRDPTLLLIIAYAVRRLPHVVRASAAGLSQAPIHYEEAAASLGAGPFTRFRRITAPLISASILAGALLTFSYSMLEVSDSLVLAQKREFFPVTKVIYELVQIIGPGPSIACAFAVWAMLFLAAALSAGSILARTSPHQDAITG